MSLAIVHSRAQVGVEAPCVSVEAHLANGLPSLTLVGLPETAVRESKDRVRSALLNAGFDFPARRITLNLAPADLPKDGGRFDLAIALGILAASGQLPGTALDGLECLGELALSGAIRPVRGVLPAALAARDARRVLVVPKENAEEASLASRLPGLLPALDEDEALEVAAIHSVASHVPLRHWPQRPFRQPHHSASAPALVGGGSRPQPGEITLAHQGVLFLDELPEFERKVLEVLREPLESGEIVIARANGRVRFPARFQLVAAMNPCPCGYLGDPSGRCRCTPEQVQRYRGKLSGPLLDRIDLHVSVLRESTSLQPGHGETATAEVSERVGAARQRQLARQGCANAHLDLQAMHRNCALAEADRRWLEAAGERLELSLRALHRILKVARTLADLERIDAIERRHLAEALQYRAMTST
ncbi:magnesium chelatase [Pseudomonas aeruginosa]|uniref:YifB family Mg chelatase-like AAA ATPase n=1 Tax=Pseudomonas aeruginosa TaxID=287 RepID=UPI00071BE8B7|nr:YifB family Mg chelatase-like AAA ATPase [Pseudomonas aeruginosa]KSS34049.1 magnesium chelatase [Pseudomonas aeruginosa]